MDLEKEVTARALATKGISAEPIYEMLRSALNTYTGPRCGVLLDVGCGTGAIRPFIMDMVERYEGADVVRYEGLPSDIPFHQINLDAKKLDVNDACMDAAVSIETIEHVENPRALVRELVRVTKPNGFIAVTTPNNLSLLSKLTLLLKNQFNAFQEPCYPAHITALLEIDLIRIMKEAGLSDIKVLYSNSGRIPGTGMHWPRGWFKGRRFSDNILVWARKN